MSAIYSWLRAPTLSTIAFLTLLLSCGGNNDSSGTADLGTRPLAEAPCLPRPPGAAEATPGLFSPAYTESSVWLADSGGGSQRKLIAGTNPQWSPDGQWLAFSDGTFDGLHFRGSLCVVRGDGTGVRQIGPFFHGDTRSECTGGTRYSWSQDASILVYESDNSTYTVSVNDSSARGQEIMHGAVSSLSPDGKGLAFSGSEPVENEPLGHRLYCGIWMTDIENSNNRQFLFPRGTSPAFSPDGARIAYVNGPRVMIGDANGGAPLVAAQMSADETVDVIRRLAWSPDGQRIAFPYDSPGNGGPVVYVVNPDGEGEPVEIGEGAEFAWSPDSKRLLLSKYQGALFIADAKYGEPENIGTGQSPSWSPDGTTIAFAR